MTNRVINFYTSIKNPIPITINLPKSLMQRAENILKIKNVDTGELKYGGINHLIIVSLLKHIKNEEQFLYYNYNK